MSRRWRTLAGAGLGWGVASIDHAVDRLGDLRRTAAFARGRLLFRPRPTDLYVATYPRSGTTWMQYLLHLLLRGPQIDFVHINDVCPWFERSLAVGTAQAVDFDGLAAPRVFKTHLLPRWLPTPGRRIYIERDPADVASSYFELYRSYLGYTGSLDAFVQRFVDGDVQYGSWWSHVEHWRAHKGDPNLLWLHYEDLRSDPVAQLARVCEFAGLDRSAPQIRDAVEGASLPRMKALEARFDHATSLLLERGVAPRQFIRTGQVGRSTLSDAQRRRVHEAPTATHRQPWLSAFLH